MKLYELTNAFAELFDRFEEIDSYDDETFRQAWFDTLSGMEEEFEGKAESIGAYIKQLTAEAAALKEEEDSLQKRRKAKEAKVRWLKQYLLESMQTIGRKTIDRPMALLSIRTNAESVQIADENEFITRCQLSGHDDYLRYKRPEIDKAVVKAALQSGQKIEGAALTRTQSIIVK